MVDYKGKVVWITGSTSGIGKAMAEEFSKHGANIIIHNYDQDARAKEIEVDLRKNGSDVLVVNGDVTNKEDIQRNVEEIKNYFGKLDILINNVGASPFKHPLEEFPEEEWLKVMDINVKSTFLVSQAAVPLLKESKGKIINTCSTVARNGGVVGAIAYTTAKGGTESLTRALAKELAPFGILVNGVAPGLVDSEFHPQNVHNRYPQLVEKIPLKRVGTPKDLTGAALFLGSEYADYITGEIIEVSGGCKLV